MMVKTTARCRWVPAGGAALMALALLAAPPGGVAAQEADEDRECICMPDMERIERRIRDAVSRPRMGVALDPERDTDRGVYVAGVAPRGGADEAGLRRGDILLSINGRALAAGDQRPDEILRDIMRDVESGDTLSVRYLRDEETRDAEVVATGRLRGFALSAGPGEVRVRMPSLPRMADGPVIIQRRSDRLRLVEMNAGLSEYFGTDRGVLVAEIEPDSELGLRSGDVVLAIDGREVEGPGHAYRILSSYTEDEEVEIRIVRSQRELVVTGRNR